ncbi:TRL domain-containing protein [Candidatus Nitrospira salsa]|nr:MAG: hypothetical protein NPIRA01_35640 [Nitrospirales bacterium]
MKKILVLFGIGLYALTLTGCGIGSLNQPSASFALAGIYSDVKGGTQVLDNGATPTKTGKSCSNQILGIVAKGDNTVEAAMADGGMNKLVYVTYELKHIVWGVYTQLCTVARGN